MPHTSLSLCVLCNFWLKTDIQDKRKRKQKAYKHIYIQFFFPEGCWTIFRNLPWTSLESLISLQSSAVDVLCSLFCCLFFLRSLGLFLSLQILVISSSNLDRGCNQKIFYFVNLPTELFTGWETHLNLHTVFKSVLAFLYQNALGLLTLA